MQGVCGGGPKEAGGADRRGREGGVLMRTNGGYGRGARDQGGLIREIRELKQKRDALILAHNYQRPEVQDICDHAGDSLELSRIAASAKQRVIVFCGVRFMAETAAILCPDKTVLLPVPAAGCPLADTATADQVRIHRGHRHRDGAPAAEGLSGPVLPSGLGLPGLSDHEADHAGGSAPLSGERRARGCPGGTGPGKGSGRARRDVCGAVGRVGANPSRRITVVTG